jgi:hypothetical protein
VGKIVLLVRPLNPIYGYIDGLFVPFREWTEQRGDIDPKKAYFSQNIDIYSARQMKQIKDELALEALKAEELEMKRKKKRRSVAPKTKTLSMVNQDIEYDEKAISGVN